MLESYDDKYSRDQSIAGASDDQIGARTIETSYVMSEPSSEGWSPGDVKQPAANFGPASAGNGGMYIYAPFKPEATHIGVDNFLEGPCSDVDSCELCNVSYSNKFDNPLDRTKPSGLCVWSSGLCTAAVNGGAPDESCGWPNTSPSWGLEAFDHMAGWSCNGEELPTPTSWKSHPHNSITTLARVNYGINEETCAEVCHLYNHAFRFWQPDIPRSGSNSRIGQRCRGFIFNANEVPERKCRVFSNFSSRYPEPGRENQTLANQCYVSKEDPNPCAWQAGQFVRDHEGSYYYVSDGGFMHEVAKESSGSSFVAPICHGVSVFGDGRTNYSDGPAAYCNGYGDFDKTCDLCVGRVKEHFMQSNQVLASNSDACSMFNVVHNNVCEGYNAELSCSGNDILVIDSARYGRMTNDYCTGHSTVPSTVADNGTCDNDVSAILEADCQGNSSCTVQITNSKMGGDPCHGVYKYMALQYRCSPPVANS
jgi:hypothetical protein